MIEYKREFTWLKKYAAGMLATEEEKCLKFEDGLNDYIRAYVTGFGHDDFSKIMTCVLNVDRKTLVSQFRISTRIRSLEVHKVLVSLHYRD